MSESNQKQFNQSEYLTILSHSPAQAVKDLAETVLQAVEGVEVLVNRTGLVMLPYTDSAQGTIFHLGEVLVSEAHIRLANGIEGYGMCTGRDLVQSLGIALLDAALTANIMHGEITTFVAVQAQSQREADDYLLRCVESTRVEMETF